MNTAAFIRAYNESRNGTESFTRHWAARNFYFSDGVIECADAGCHWLLDIAATELPQAMRKHQALQAFLEVAVKDGAAKLSLTVSDDLPPIWSRSIDFTDLPEGDWVFELVDESERVAMILISEH